MRIIALRQSMIFLRTALPCRDNRAGSREFPRAVTNGTINKLLAVGEGKPEPPLPYSASPASLSRSENQIDIG